MQIANHSPGRVLFKQSSRAKSRSGLKELEVAKTQQYLPVIESIATGTPEYVTLQTDAAQFVASLPSLEQNRFRIEKLYKATRIETRHLAVNLLSAETAAFSQQRGTIETRMQMYETYAVPLAERVARQALERAAASWQTQHAPDQNRFEDSIRLIVFVSSTGFVAPGIDAQLIKSLGLRRDIARVPVNFMGCAAAMNGLRVACDHVRAHPAHKALVICLELSSVNAVFEDDVNDVIIHSLFGDGCAAVVVGAAEAEQAMAQGSIVIRDNFSYLAEDTEDGITLGVRDNGITCKLSRQLPDYIEAGVDPIIERFLRYHELTKAEIDLWAVHPGGTRIIDKVQSSLGLRDDQLIHSWEILRQYGNMLSASILFVIERMLAQCDDNLEQLYGRCYLSKTAPLTGIAFSFSPGVGVEGLLFQKSR